MRDLMWTPTARNIQAPDLTSTSNLFDKALGSFRSIVDDKVKHDTSSALESLYKANTPEELMKARESITGNFIDKNRVNTEANALQQQLLNKENQDRMFGLKEGTLGVQRDTLTEQIRNNQVRESISQQQADTQDRQVTGNLDIGQKQLNQRDAEFVETHKLNVDKFKQQAKQWEQNFDLTRDSFGLDKERFELLKQTQAFNEYMQLDAASRADRQEEFNNRMRNETLALQQNADTRAQKESDERSRDNNESRLFNQMQAALPETQRAFNDQLRESLFNIVAPVTGGGYNAVQANEAIARSIRTDGSVDLTYLNNSLSNFIDTRSTEGKNLLEDILVTAQDIAGKNANAMSQAITAGAKYVPSISGAVNVLDSSLSNAATPYSTEADTRRKQEIELRALEYNKTLEGLQPVSVSNLEAIVNDIYGEDYSKSARNQAKEYVGKVVGGKISEFKNIKFTQSQIAEALAAGYNPGFLFNTFNETAFLEALRATENKSSTINAERLGIRMPTAP